MGDNSFGTLFSFTSFGESHGPGIGCIVDGAPPRVPLSENLVQPYLDRRKPGRGRAVLSRSAVRMIGSKSCPAFSRA